MTNLEFYLQMIPPASTAQMRQVRVVNGRPMFYEPARVREARAQLTEHLAPHRPDEPMEGPLRLVVTWNFPCGKSHKDGAWKSTKPDTDNLQKLLKDVMTQLGFWKDDALVASETIEKFWAREPGIYISIEQLRVRP